MTPGHDRLAIRDLGEFPFDDKFLLAPLVTGIRVVNFVVQAVEFVEALVDLSLELRLSFQDPADFLVEAGDAAPHPCDVSRGIVAPRHFSPEELAGLQLGEPIEDVAGLPQGVETLPVGGKGFQLSLCRAHLTLEPGERSPHLLDLRVQRRQFLF